MGLRFLFAYDNCAAIWHIKSLCLHKKNGKTIITMDAEDIFTMVRESDTKLFSVDSISAYTVAFLCPDIRKRVAEHIGFDQKNHHALADAKAYVEIAKTIF